jgi:hypothetical protein
MNCSHAKYIRLLKPCGVTTELQYEGGGGTRRGEGACLEARMGGGLEERRSESDGARS